MANPKENFAVQLKEICKVTQARWAVWLKHSDSRWDFGPKCGLSAVRQQILQDLIHERVASTWLAGAFSSGRTRFRQIPSKKAELGCSRIYIFPNLQTHTALLVGAEQLEKSAESFFKVLALSSPFESQPEAAHSEGYQELSQADSLSLRTWDTGLEMSYNPEGVLGNVLEFLVGIVPCEAALMSVRSGDLFRVEAVWQCPTALIGMDISMRENETLAEMVVTRQGVILADQASFASDRVHQQLSAALQPQAASMLGIPVIIGQRVIGHVAFISSRPQAFSPIDLQRAAQQAGRLAYVVENAIVFAEAARYLQQLALLNELASAASLGVDAHEVSRRVMQRLQRTFKTDQVGVFLLSPDGKMLREYGVEGGELEPLNIPVETSTIGYVVESGLPLRAEGVTELPGRSRFLAREGEGWSELIVPLKYRGKVIGTLALASSSGKVFTQQDEQLLIVIASHLAGLFENMRLNEETRERAHHLSLIHQVVMQVIGLTDLDQIAQVAAELMVKRFSYDSAGVVLLDAHGQDRIVRAASAQAESCTLDPSQWMAMEQVLKDGTSRLVGNDASGDSPRGSEMCVPMREGARVLGAIIVGRTRRNAFAENDLLALDALAGVMASVVISALRYQQLQYSVRQLTAVRETALDIAADLDLDALFKRVVHRARELVGTKGAELGLLNEDDQVVQIVVSETPWDSPMEDRIPLLAGVAGKVAAFGEPLVVEDYNTWSGRLYPDREAPFRAVAGVPLKFQGKVIGTLTVIDDRPDWKFQPEHVQLLELLAPQVTVWIRHARLYQELQERIEAQRLAESRLIRSARLAAVGEMAAGVAHELNNPLTTVTGFTELVLDELPADSPHREDLDLVLREAHRARGVVRRMLDFSRPVENQRIRTDVNELVSDVLALVSHLVRTGGVEIVRDLQSGPKPLPWIYVDPSQMKQVLLNLIHNAIQSMPKGGQLRIGMSLTRTVPAGSLETQSWVSVSVQDTGEGISPENMDRLFEPFFTTRPAGAGTGLGLSVSYGIVGDHGGYIDVESTLSQGSCFTVYLPVESDEE